MKIKRLQETNTRMDDETWIFTDVTHQKEINLLKEV